MQTSHKNRTVRVMVRIHVAARALQFVPHYFVRPCNVSCGVDPADERTGAGARGVHGQVLRHGPPAERGGGLGAREGGSEFKGGGVTVPKRSSLLSQWCGVDVVADASAVPLMSHTACS